MGANRGIIEAIQRITGTQLTDKVNLFAATVDSVDEVKRTCTVTTVSSQAPITIESVQLMASVDDGLLLIPSIDSTVIVVYSTFNKPFIALFSGIDKVRMIADNGIQLNDGEMGGLVKVIELTEKLNTLEQNINQLKQLFTSWTPVSGDGGAALKTVVTSWAGQSITPTQRADIENTNITQG